MNVAGNGIPNRAVTHQLCRFYLQHSWCIFPMFKYRKNRKSIAAKTHPTAPPQRSPLNRKSSRPLGRPQTTTPHRDRRQNAFGTLCVPSNRDAERLDVPTQSAGTMQNTHLETSRATTAKQRYLIDRRNPPKTSTRLLVFVHRGCRTQKR
jgi:hypothetical protein